MKKLIFFSVYFYIIGNCVQLSAQRLEIDLRTDTTKKKYFVGLAVRDDTFTGHAFVVLYHQENIGNEKIDLKVYGYYPKTIATIPIPIGEVKNDSNCLKHIPPEGEIYFIVDYEAFMAAKKVVDTWTAHPPIFTLLINCIDMLDEVAMSIGVNLPSRYGSIRSLVPEHYMKYIYKKLQSRKGLTYNKNYRLRLVTGLDKLIQVDVDNKLTKVIGNYISKNTSYQLILNTLE